MKYVYDIILNFNENLYDFFEWNENDNVDYIKKIPIFKVSQTVMRDLVNCKVKIDKKFIQNIKNKCEIYMKNSIGNIEYACLFFSDEKIIAIEFNYKGVSIFKSDLLIDESLDIIEYYKKIRTTKLDYMVIMKDDISFLTRKEENMIRFIEIEFKRIIESNDMDKLKYLYYECFKKLNNNLNKMIKDLEKYITRSPKELFDVLKLSCSNRN
ncbi:MAG: hypothetical protein II119_00995 [Bacilli bacterium]|nr:hypothetical protein [Bacilli bacterium]